MNCTEIHNKLIFYYFNELSVKEAGNIETHLHVCPKCLELYKKLKLSMDIINKEKNSKINPLLTNRISKKINELENNALNTKIRKIRILRHFAAAAVIATAVTIGVLTGNSLLTQTNNHLQEISEDAYYLNDFHQERAEAFLLNE